jgi:hypothetical protein
LIKSLFCVINHKVPKNQEGDSLLLRAIMVAAMLLLLAEIVMAEPPSRHHRRPIMAKVKFNVQKTTWVRVRHDTSRKHHVDEVFATNRPDIFKPGRQYKIVFSYRDRHGRMMVKTITRRVLDAPRNIGGKPNLELCLYDGNKRVLHFVRSYLNGRTVKVFAI